MVDDTHKMLRAIINGQSTMKSELLVEIKKVNKKVDNLEIKVDNGFKGVNKRIDKIGLQVANLDDDTPTRDEFDKLEIRVRKTEVKVASV